MLDHYFPKFLANSLDPDQTPPKGTVLSGSTLIAIPSASFGDISQKLCQPVLISGWESNFLTIFECQKIWYCHGSP